MAWILRRIKQFSVGNRFCSIYSVDNVLNDDNMSKTISRLKSITPVMMEPARTPKAAAVLIPLCVVRDRVSLLYTLRTSHLSSHKGQVSFPGGMQDTADEDLVETALRETKEELGIDPKDVRVWGTGGVIVARGTTVLPVVGQISGELDLDRLNMNPQEVEEVFTVSLRDLCDRRKNGYTQFKDAYSTPVFLGGRRRIWGLTAVITNLFLKALLPHEAYSHRIFFIKPIVTSSTCVQST